MADTYWRKQTPGKPLFPDIEWNKPERKSQAGKLLIVGGNKLGFSSPAESYGTALATGAGQVRVLLPDALKKTVPKTLLDVVYGASNPSGSLAAGAETELKASSEWSNGVLLIGDAGRNSETAILYEKFISSYSGPLTVTRDTIDLVKNNPNLLVDRPETLIVASFAQVQKLFQGVYYPKMLTFNMQLLLLVESLHKFTVTYPATIVTLHNDNLIIAHGGEVITQAFTEPMRIWRGEIATKMATYWLWNQETSLESVVASIVI